MNSRLIRPLLMGVFAFPLLVIAQQGSEGRLEPAVGGGQMKYSDPGNNFFSNVPINELSAKAYRRFHRRFREVPAGEYWFKYADGYQVSFTLDQHREVVYYNSTGNFLYSLKYFGGSELPRDVEQFVKRRFPDYKIDLVTEVDNAQGMFYMLQIMNPDHIKVLTIADGKIDIIKDLNNGSANIGPAEAAR